jgi:hypothetical protein
MPIEFSAKNNTWQGNLHYIGQSAVRSSRQTWDVMFEFGCVTELATSQLGASVWKFALTVKNKDLTTGETFYSRFLVTFSSGTVCPDDRRFDGFTFKFNVNNLSVTPSNTGSVIFFDDDLMFRSSPGFIANPLLNINIVPQKKASNSTLKQPWERQLRASQNLI